MFNELRRSRKEKINQIGKIGRFTEDLWKIYGNIVEIFTLFAVF
jgi:hypothetical protein